VSIVRSRAASCVFEARDFPLWTCVSRHFRRCSQRNLSAGRLAAVFVCLVLLPCGTLLSQTTQGLISGRIVDSQSGQPISGAEIRCLSASSDVATAVLSDSSGYYAVASLSPGFYRIRVVADRYQSQEVHEQELLVAGRIDLSFRLRPLNDVWETGQYRSVFLPSSKLIVTFYGPDVDPSRSESLAANQGKTGTLESTVSNVVSPAEIEDLPLAGRDVFTMLVTQPGVAADTTTARSLGLSTNGQRPSSSNFLLDGLEFNNYLVTGPFTALPPEAIQEYRISTNNFSAEYGRTSGYLANAVTKSGSDQWHGVGYFNFKNDVLNANDFQSNLRGYTRTPNKEHQAGGQFGGPILKESLFISASVDYLRSRTRQLPRTVAVPTLNILRVAAPDSAVRRLLTEFPPPEVPGVTSLFAPIAVSPTVSVDRWLALSRVDYLLSGGKHRMTARPIVSRLSRPDFVWSPYKDLVGSATENETGFALAAQSSFRPNLTNEARLGGSWSELNLPRPHPEIPVLTGSAVTVALGTIESRLPSSRTFASFDNRPRSWELLDNLVWSHGAHLVTTGGGILWRGLDGSLAPAAQVIFDTLATFAQDAPTSFRAPLDRTFLPSTRVLPPFDREYRWNQYFFFFQDTFRVTPRFVLNFGLRYENFGSPKNSGSTKDTVVQLGSGNSLLQRLVNGQLVVPPGGNQSIYDADHNDWAPRFGFSYSLDRAGKIVLRGGYGVFYDRLFDNAWQNVRNNKFINQQYGTVPVQPSYLSPVASLLPLYATRAVAGKFGIASGGDFNLQSSAAPLTMLQPGLRTPYVQSFFLGLQQSLPGRWSVELNGLGSLGHKLITADLVNRTGIGKLGQPPGPPATNDTLPAPPIIYRANQGDSNYTALTAVVRHRAGWAQFQLAYTWSHSIDNQSDPLKCDYFNLTAVTLTSLGPCLDVAAFTLEGNSRADRGNSSFDQRQNLVFFSILDLPAPKSTAWLAPILRGWKFSQLAAFRSGVPYTLYATNPFVQPYNGRLNLVNPALLSTTQDVAGGKQLIPRAAFAAPAAGTPGNTGRNAFTGPGFYNVDISVGRTFSLRWLGESGRVTVRADAFNFLNHANLNQPCTILNPTTTPSCSGFGVATYGRSAQDSTLPVLSPVNDTSRQIQLIVRLTF
jgi:hypothetical protein